MRLGIGNPGRRGRIILVATLFVFSLFVAQLFRIQGLDSATTSKEALDSRLAHVTLPAQRGSIISSDGTVLADSVARVNITSDPTLTRTYAKTADGKTTVLGLRGAAHQISTIVGADPEDVLARLQRASDKDARFAYVVKDVTPKQWRKVQSLHIPGIFSEPTSKRIYPQGTSIAPVLGWVGSNGKGGGGIELMKNSVLSGTPGVRAYEQAPDGTVIASGKYKDVPAVNGKDLKLTIDNDLQWYAQNAIAATVKKFGALSGDAVVMDVHGNLKAIASYPSFDNNSMRNAPEYLRSRPFNEVYEPGSTGKIITMSALLQQKKANPLTHVVVPPTLTRAGTTFHDSEVHGTEHLTLAGVLAESSNIGTMKAGSRMSPKTTYEYLRKFGLGRTSGLNFPGESAGILPDYKTWSGTKKLTVLYGQGYSATAIQEVQAVQTIANLGVREPAKLIKGVRGSTGGWQEPDDQRKPVRVVSPSVAKEVTRMMEGVVTDGGTAPKARVPGYNVAGKTGTADRYDPKLQRYNGQTASFIGFAPAKHPKYIVAVTVQRPTKHSIYGGEVAGPTFSKIMSYALHRAHIPPSTSKPRLYPFTFDPSGADKK